MGIGEPHVLLQVYYRLGFNCLIVREGPPLPKVGVCYTSSFDQAYHVGSNTICSRGRLLWMNHVPHQKCVVECASSALDTQGGNSGAS